MHNEEGTPERSLYSAILLTYFTDIARWTARIRKFRDMDIEGKKRKGGGDNIRYYTAHAKNLLINANHPWTKHLCALGNVEHEFFLDRLHEFYNKQVKTHNLGDIL